MPGGGRLPNDGGGVLDADLPAGERVGVGWEEEMRGFLCILF